MVAALGNLVGERCGEAQPDGHRAALPTAPDVERIAQSDPGTGLRTGRECSPVCSTDTIRWIANDRTSRRQRQYAIKNSPSMDALA